MSKKKVKKKLASSVTFETSLTELETIVGELEGGDLELDAMLGRYESGVRHLKACYKLLDSAERKIELITGFDADGNPVKQPYGDDEDDSLAEKADSRSQKRSAVPKRKAKQDVDDSDTLF